MNKALVAIKGAQAALTTPQQPRATQWVPSWEASAAKSGGRVVQVGEVAVVGAEYYGTALLRHLGKFAVLELAMAACEEHVSLVSEANQRSCFLWSRPLISTSHGWCLFVVAL